MLRYQFNMQVESELIEHAVEQVLTDNILTADLVPKFNHSSNIRVVSCNEMGDAISNAILAPKALLRVSQIKNKFESPTIKKRENSQTFTPLRTSINLPIISTIKSIDDSQVYLGYFSSFYSGLIVGISIALMLIRLNKK